MVFENFENILTLLCTVVGLLLCLFKYIEVPKRGYLYLIVFFLAHFFADYYWTIYTIVMQLRPEVSELVAYFGWNVGYIFLFLAIFHIQDKRARNVLHPVVFWPVLTNSLQLFLYMKFGSILNNLWMVGWTTLTMILCIILLGQQKPKK